MTKLHPPAPAPVAGMRILIVDDDSDIRDFLAMFLTSQGAEVMLNDYSGDVGALVRLHHPDAILLDLQRGDDRYAGLSVLEKLCIPPLHNMVPFVMMSGDHASLTTYGERIRALGATVLPKPFELDRLLELLQPVQRTCDT